MLSPKFESLQHTLQALRSDDGSGIPKHARLTQALTDVIRAGVWKAGEKIPSEEEIVQLSPYSLGTVQRALRNLAERGLIVRQHGLGSFVAEPSKKVAEPWHCRFLADDKTSFLPLYTQTLERTLEIQPGAWTHYLGAGPDIMRLDRIIDVNHEFQIYGKFYAAVHTLPRLWDMPIERLNGMNFKEVIVSEFKLPITDIVHLVTLRTFPDDVRLALNLKPETQGLQIQAIAYAGPERCVYYQEFYVPPTSRVLSFPEASINRRN